VNLLDNLLAEDYQNNRSQVARTSTHGYSLADLTKDIELDKMVAKNQILNQKLHLLQRVNMS
jgi:hypothetical protein